MARGAEEGTQEKLGYTLRRLFCGRFVAASLAVLPIVLGCSGPGGSTPGGDSPNPRDPPRVFDGAGGRSINGGAGVLNPGFEFWAEDLPLHWSVMRAREGRARPSAEKTGGTRGLVTGPGYTHTRIEQRVTLGGDFAGRRLTFSADVMTSSPDTARLEIRIGGEIAARGEAHSGSGEWERLEVGAALPKTFGDEPVDVVLFHYGSPPGACFFDNASVD